MTIEQKLMDIMEAKQDEKTVDAGLTGTDPQPVDAAPAGGEPAVSIDNPLSAGTSLAVDGQADADQDIDELEGQSPDLAKKQAQMEAATPEEAKAIEDQNEAAYRAAKSLPTGGFSDDEQKIDDTVKNSPSLKESVMGLLVGEDLTEDFKFKAATIFEAAVKNKVEDIRAELSESYSAKEATLVESFAQKEKALVEEFEAKLTEAKADFEVQLSEKIDAFHDTLAEQWLKHNEVALEAGLKSELTESFIDGMKSLFEAHYVDLPEEKFDIISEMESKNVELEKTLSEQIQYAAELKGKYDSVTRDVIIKESAKGLTDMDAARLNKLVEDVEFENETTFAKRVSLIRESFFRSKDVNTSIIEEDKKIDVSTEALVEEKQVSVPENDRMASYIKFLNSGK